MHSRLMVFIILFIYNMRKTRVRYLDIIIAEANIEMEKVYFDDTSVNEIAPA